MKNRFSSSQNDLESALGNLVIYNKYGDWYTGDKTCGLCVFIPIVFYNSKYYSWGSSDDYPASATKFTAMYNYSSTYLLS